MYYVHIIGEQIIYKFIVNLFSYHIITAELLFLFVIKESPKSGVLGCGGLAASARMGGIVLVLSLRISTHAPVVRLLAVMLLLLLLQSISVLSENYFDFSMRIPAAVVDASAAAVAVGSQAPDRCCSRYPSSPSWQAAGK